MRPFAVLAAIVLLVLGPFAGPAFGASWRDRYTQSPPTPALQLVLTEVTPRVVTAGGSDQLVVAGTLRNTGNVPVRQLKIRVQRGDVLRSEGELRNALDGRNAADAVAPRFTDLPGELAPGAEMPVRLTVPLQGSPDTGLALSRPGVYELLVNVNGIPDRGDRARLAAVRMLLPVLSLPAGTTADRPAAAPDQPVPVTVLYPIADTPRLLPTVPGEPALLTDDDLAASLAPDGRLGGLVSALTTAAPPGSPARAATCVAIDPDLVQTVAAMREGYQVRGADGVPVPGTGSEVAEQWLDALTEAVRGMCVIALPSADIDMIALTEGGLSAQVRQALTEGPATLAGLLRTPSVPGVTWPANGVLDEATLAEVAAAGSRAVVLSADAVTGGRSQIGGTVAVAGAAQTSQLGLLTDPLLTRAASGPTQATGTLPRTSRATAPTSAAGQVGPLATQDLIGALAFRMRSGAAGATPLIIAPPHQWATDGTGAAALLNAVNGMASAGLVTPHSLAAAASAELPEDARPRRLSAPLVDAEHSTPSVVVTEIRDMLADIEDLASAAVEVPGVGATPEAVFTPLRQAALRPASAAWHGRTELADRQARLTAGRIGELRASVRVLEPPSPFSLGTTTAPLLLTVANGLPVTMRVQLEITSTTGLRVDPIPEVTVPPLGRRQVEVAAEVVRSGRFSVEALVRTPSGGLLGMPSRLQVRSTAYGTITVWLTGSAGVLLVVLAARRVLRRIQGESTARRARQRAGSPGSPDPEPPPGPPHRDRDPAAPDDSHQDTSAHTQPTRGL